MVCKRCKKPFTTKDLLEGLCVDCIFEVSKGLRTLSREDVRKAKAAVEAETAGLVPSAFLGQVLSDLLSDVENGEDPELARVKAENAVQRLAGIGMCREMIRLAESLSELAREIEEEARCKLRTLSNLGSAE